MVNFDVHHYGPMDFEHTHNADLCSYTKSIEVRNNSQMTIPGRVGEGMAKIDES